MMADTEGNNKPSVLVLGGVGFIGRNLVHHLVTNELASKIRVVDKVMPGMAWLNNKHKDSFKQVEFKHANLINAKSVTNAFTSSDGVPFDLVINCAGETKYGHSEAVYRDGIFKLSINCAKEAARQKCRRYMEISSAHMHATDKKPIKEDIKCEPWTVCSKQKYMVERELKNIPNLDYVIIRPAIVYGPGDKAGLTPLLVVGGVYKYLKEKMKMLWTESLKMNTVHVVDLVRAIWFLCCHSKTGEVYNLADHGDTTQGKLGELVSELFNINHDYLGTLVSNMAKLSVSDIVEEINEKHMIPWGEVCRKDGITSTPLHSYLDQEQLADKGLCVDGTKIESLGFTYEHPKVNVELLREVLNIYSEMDLFPPSLLKPA